MKPRELTAALSAVVGATCVVAFAVVYLFAPELPLGPTLGSSSRLPSSPQQSYGPPNPPPNASVPTVVPVQDEAKAEANETKAQAPVEDRWRPDTLAKTLAAPAKVSSGSLKKKKAAKKAALKKVAPPVVETPNFKEANESVAKVAVETKKEEVVIAPEVAALATQREIVAAPEVDAKDERFAELTTAPIVETVVEAPPLLTAAPVVEGEAEAEPVADVAVAADAAVPALVAAAEATVEAPAAMAATVIDAATDVVAAAADAVPSTQAEPIVVTAPVEASAPAATEAEKVSPSAEPELVGGNDVVEAIATNALDVPSEDEGALNTLSAAEIEADRWLTQADGTAAYPGAPDAGTLWTESGAAGNAATTLAALEMTASIPESLPEEVDTVPSIAAIQPNDFSDIRERFLALSAEVDKLPTIEPFQYVAPVEESPADEPTVVAANTEPTPELVAPKAAEPEPVVKTAAELEAEWAKEKSPAPEPELVRPKAKIREALVTETELRPKQEAADLEQSIRRQVSNDVVALDPIVETSKTLLASAAPSAKRAAVATQPIGRVLDARQEFAAIQGTQAPAAVVSTAPALGNPPVVAQRDDERNRAVDTRQMIFGQLRFGKAVEAWLEAKRGHVELYLQPENTRDPSDTIYVDYHFPQVDFQIERGGLVGRYRLIAGVFAPSSPVAVAQIPYGKLLADDNFKERVRFYLDDATFERALAGTAAGVAKSVALHLSLYSAGTSNFQGKGADGDGSFRQPTPIGGGTVRIVGVGDVAPVKSDAEGNARFSRVPSRSDLLVEVSAPGFMKSYVVVPVADGPTYQPVYLIAKDKVETITTYFTRRPQRNGAAVVMGRVFDTAKRRPEAGQKVHLQNRQGPPVYFGALPDLTLESTQKNGLFGFYNVDLSPAFRTIAREERDAIPYLLHLRPNTGTYVELGRGGARALLGRLYDPFKKKPVVGTVRLVGTETVRVETDDKGFFRIDDLEFPPGIVTFEVDADGYPVTWVNVSWNPRDPEKTRTFFLVDDSKVSAEHDRGSLVGGAESELFKKTEGCLTVTLESLEHGVAKPSQGPEPLLPSGEKTTCISAKAPGFTFHDLPPGEWNLRWTDAQNQTLRTRVVRIGQGRVTVVVN